MYNRVLLKLTGELFGGGETGINFTEVERVAKYIASLKSRYQLDLAIVIGGGNLFRGRNMKETNFDRAQADFIGMMGTIMNGLALQGELNLLKVPSRVMSGLQVNQACEPYIRLKAIHNLNKGEVVILVGGVGRPYFTTDTSAALLAAELDCEALLKGSNVDAVYSADPKKDANAVRYKSLSFQEALVRGLMVMDDTAFAICKREKIPVIIFNIGDLRNIEKILDGVEVGTLIA